MKIPELYSYFKDKGMSEGNKEEYSWIHEPQKVFKLSEREQINIIQNDLINKNGKSIPFTYGNQRYVSISSVKEATKTSEVEKKIKQ